MNSTGKGPETGSQVPSNDPLQERGIYRIRSRNLTVGVYDGKGGFIGIREKFGSLYLFTEYAWEQGPPYGTVRIEGREGVGWCPPEIKLTETLGTKCGECGEQVTFDMEVTQWVGCRCSGRSTRAMSIPNQELYRILEASWLPEEREGAAAATSTWSRRSALHSKASTKGRPSSGAADPTPSPQ